MVNRGRQFCYLIFGLAAVAFEESETIIHGSRLHMAKTTNDMQYQENNRYRREANLKTSYTFNDDLQSAVVDAHNNARSSVSPTAANMRQMRWNDGLGKLAADYASQCVYKHNKDRSRNSEFESVGENLYISSGISNGKIHVEGAIQAWYNEKSDYIYSRTSCRPGKICGHYTQIAWADTYAVGCGAASCSSVVVNGEIWNDATIVVCNYGPGGNSERVKPYEKGETCSKCEKSLNVCDKNLCSSSQTSVMTTTSPTTGRPHWKQWSSWAQCSVTCGSGTTHKTRQCSTGNQHDCKGISSRSKACKAEECSLNAYWKQWGEWSPCNVPCGQGRRYKYRTCSSGDVSDCRGLYYTSKICNGVNCSP